MPFIKWYGVTDTGSVVRGVRFARSESWLKEALARDRIDLLHAVPQCKLISQRSLLKVRVGCFEQLGWLLGGGIRLVDALAIVAIGIDQQYVRHILLDCCEGMREGFSFSEMAVYHPDFFSPFACRLLSAGEQSGSLGRSCEELAEHSRVFLVFAEKIRYAIMGPLITVVGFLVMVLGLVYGVIPRFGAVLRSLKKPLPWRTELVLGLSDFMRTPQGAVFLAVVGVGFLMGLYVFRRRVGSDSVLFWIYIPGMRSVAQESAAAVFFKTLGSLIQGGVSLTKALQLAPLGISSLQVREAYEKIAYDVAEGSPLSESVAKHYTQLDLSCKTLLEVGEATGNMGVMIQACGTFYHNRVIDWCKSISYFVQPLLLLALGVCIAVLIIALYEPILSMGMMLE